MPPRVTPEEVEAILDPTAIAAFPDLQPFITTANIGVNRYLQGKGPTEEELTEIEKWWSAHNVTLAAPQLQSDKYDIASTGYALPELTTGFNSTSYGRMVIAMDWTNTLAAIGGKTALREAF